MQNEGIHHEVRGSGSRPLPLCLRSAFCICARGYTGRVQKKVFWLIFIALSLLADFELPLLWGLLATIPIVVLSWWIAYRSEWFED